MKSEKLRPLSGAELEAPHPDIETRTFDFSLRIIKLCQKLDERPGVGRILGCQLLRSGTTIGANVEEAQAAQSRADFLSEMNIALKEARESRYWLRLIQGAKVIQPERLSNILGEATEVANVLGAIVRTTRGRMA